MTDQNDRPARNAVYSELMWPEYNPTSESYGTGAEKANALLDAFAAEERAAVPAGPAPATDRAALHDRIAQVIREFPFDDFGLDDISYLLESTPDTQEWVPKLADAVLAVLPEPADKAAVYAEVADRLAADAEQGSKEGWTRIYRRSAAQQVRDWGDALRRLADEAQQGETDEERADREETERDHARGDHTHCGITCETEMPTEHLRNFVIAKGYPGTKGALAELERRAAVAVDRVRHVLEMEPVLNRTALEYRGLVQAALMAAETQPDELEPDEDPARIDRLRPEFAEHSSVEAIDAQLKRARAQERRWHLRTEWLISLRQHRVTQKDHGEQPAAEARQDGAQH